MTRINYQKYKFRIRIWRGEYMKCVDELNKEVLSEIVKIIINAIMDNEVSMAEFATEVGDALLKYDLIN